MKILSLRTSDPWCSAQQIRILMLASGKHTISGSLVWQSASFVALSVPRASHEAQGNGFPRRKRLGMTGGAVVIPGWRDGTPVPYKKGVRWLTGFTGDS